MGAAALTAAAGLEPRAEPGVRGLPEEGVVAVEPTAAAAASLAAAGVLGDVGRRIEAAAAVAAGRERGDEGGGSG